MQVTKIQGTSSKHLKQMIKMGRYSSVRGQYIALEQIPKERGIEMLAEIRRLFGKTVDLQVLLLDAMVKGDDNPVWDRNSSSARRHFYHGTMSENIQDVDFAGFC
jgi:hypothetical protein